MVLYLGSDWGRHISGQSFGVCGNFESYRSPLTVEDTDLRFSVASLVSVRRHLASLE